MKLIANKLSCTGEKPYACMTCRKQFTKWFTKRFTYLVRQSTGMKINNIKMIKKIKKIKMIMKVMMIGTGDKPYACPPCRKQLKNGSLTWLDNLLVSRSRTSR